MTSLPLLAVFILFLSIQKGELFKLPKASNGTDDDVNLKIVHGNIGNHNLFPYQVSCSLLESLQASTHLKT